MPIQLPDLDPCPYCETFEGRYPSHGPPAVIFEDDDVFVFLAPAALGGMEGHTLVIPRRHVETIFDLDDAEASALMTNVRRAAAMLRAALDLDGLMVTQHNGVAGNQTVPHVHFHVIPRREGVPYPPTEWVSVTPAAERAEQADRLRPHWPA